MGYSMYGFFKFMLERVDFSMTADTWLGLPLTMLRCFFHRSWGVQIYLNLGCGDKTDKLKNRFMRIIILSIKGCVRGLKLLKIYY